MGAALVFGLSVTMSGLAAGFDREAERTVAIGGADHWTVDEGSAGPFTGSIGIPREMIDVAAAQEGVTAASGVLVAPVALNDAGTPTLLNLIGVQPGRLGAPSPLTAPNEAVVDEQLGHSVGDTISLIGLEFEVVDVVRSSMLAGAPNVYLQLEVAQALAVDGQDLVSAVLTTGVAPEIDGLRALTAEEAIDNALLRLVNAKSTIALVRTILWIVAALVIGSVLYLNAQERTRDFAVFKATGATTTSIVIGLAVQAVAIAAVASVLAIIIGMILGPVMPMSVETPTSAYVLLPIVVLAVSLLGSIAGARRAATVPPAVAFGG